MTDVLALKALVMGVVEGLTEFLPVSSTGHLILAGALLQFNSEKGKVFEIVIQTGALLAVVWEYRAKLFGVFARLPGDRQAQRFVLNLIVAFLPAAVFGLAFAKAIKAHLFQPVPVALAFILGAFVILWAERRVHTVRVTSVDAMTPLDALKVGCVQCLALIPGTSRSGATIIGGLLFGLSRQAATEFSFFLALPTLTAAGAYQLYLGARPAVGRRHRLVRRGSDRRLRLRVAVRALAPPVHQPPQLRDVRVVSHRFWRRGTRHGLAGADCLDGGLTLPGCSMQWAAPKGATLDDQDLPPVWRAVQVVRIRVSGVPRAARRAP